MTDEAVPTGSEQADPFRLDGRVAFVTGSARGIGRESALALARAGASVACVDLDEPVGTAAAIRAEGGDAWSATVDVTSVEAVARLVQSIVERSGRLDIAVNNAGIHDSAPALDVTAELMERMYRVNSIGVLNCSQAAARVMIARGMGSIVNIASSAVDSSVADNLAYSASKAAVRQMTRIMAREWGEGGVRVNAVCPGWIETTLTRTSNPGEDLEAKRKAVMDRQALPVEGQAQYVANTVRFLASDASTWMTGQALRVDGGMAMAW